MKFRIFLILQLLACVAAAEDTNFFDTMRRVEMPPARVFTISPGQVKAGIITELVVQGEHFRPVNAWTIPGVRVLKQQYVDSRTVILTVLAGSTPGLRSVSLPGSIPLSLDILAADTLLSDDFEDGDIAGWNASKGVWLPAGGQVQVNGSKKGLLFPTLENTDNITVDWDMTLVSGKMAGIMFHYRDSKNYRAVLLDGNKSIIRLFDRFNGGFETKLRIPFPGALNSQHHYTLAVADNQVSLFVDGALFFTRNLGYIYSGQVALYSKVGTALFDNVVVTHDPAANIAPQAAFTTFVSGSDLTVDASPSIDPNGTIAAYGWSFGDGTTGSGPALNHTYLSNGTYTVILTVTDNSGARNKTVRTITVSVLSDAQAIKDVVSKFFVLLADLEFRSPQEICQDFSRDPACPAYDKQVDDLAAGQPSVQWFDVEFLSDVSVTFESSTVAYPVRIRNKLEAMYFGDPNLYYTDGWHIYRVVKESDGKWHQCSYTFQLISTNEN